MDKISENARRWVVQAAKTGGIPALSACLFILETHEKFEECSEIVEALRFICPEKDPSFWIHPMSQEAMIEMLGMVGGYAALSRNVHLYVFEIFTALNIQFPNHTHPIL